VASSLPQKIGILWALGLLWAPLSAPAAEFVPYGEARQALETPSVADGSASVEDLRALIENGTAVRIFDARSKAEFDREHIAGAALPHEEAYYRDLELFRQQIVRAAPDVLVSLSRSTAGLAKEEAIITYCNRRCGAGGPRVHERALA
jgi:rhodanese-related sulfurtransferase